MLVQITIVCKITVTRYNGDCRQLIHIQFTVFLQNLIGIEFSIGEGYIKGVIHTTRHRQSHGCRITDGQHITRRQSVGRSMRISIVACSYNYI